MLLYREKFIATLLTISFEIRTFIVKKTEILFQHICDGHFDFEDGWDESPHHCIGDNTKKKLTNICI